MAKQGSLGIAPAPGRGSAVILGREAPNLFDLMQKKEDLAREDEANKRKQAQDAGKRIGKMMEYNPDEVWAPYNQYIQDEIKTSFYDPLKQVAKEGRIPTGEEEINAAEAKTRVDGQINQVNAFKTATQDIFKFTSKGDDRTREFNPEAVQEYYGHLFENAPEDQIFYDSKGQKRIKPDFLSAELANSVYEIPDIYNVGNMSYNLSEKINANMSSIIEEDFEGHTETNVKSKFYELNEDGSIAYDSDGNKKLNISPELLNRAMKEKSWRVVIEDEKERIADEEGRNDVSNMDAFQKIMKPQAYFEEKAKKDISATKRQLMKRGQKKKALVERKKMIEGIQKGDPRALNFLKQSVINKQTVKDVEYDTSGEDAQIIFKLADGTQHKVSLGEETGGSFGELNTVINTLKGQEQFSVEDLSTVGAAPKQEQGLQIDLDKMNTDINIIQNNPEEGGEILSKIPGITDIEFEEGGAFSEGGFYTFKDDGEEKRIDVTEEAGGGYEELKNLLSERSKEKYTRVGGKKKIKGF